MHVVSSIAPPSRTSFGACPALDAAVVLLSLEVPSTCAQAQLHVLMLSYRIRRDPLQLPIS